MTPDDIGWSSLWWLIAAGLAIYFVGRWLALAWVVMNHL
jgi:hypothetical protein